MRVVFLAAVLACGLAGCQTPGGSYASAEDVCLQQARPGTRTYQRCVSANYAANRRASQETANAVAAGATAGLIGGAVIAASSEPYYGGGYYYGPGYYRPGYYGRSYWRGGYCRGYGCW